MSKVEKIKAEIKKRYKDNQADGYTDVCEELFDLCTFIDSLEEEPISNDLEKAAHSYVDTTIEHFDSEGNPCCYPAFIAGAQWQKERDQSTIELAEDHAYLAGQEKIIAKACEWLENYFKGVSSGTVYLEDFKKAIKE